MSVARLPAISINCGQVFSMTATISDSAGVAVNLTAWTGRFRIAESYTATALLDVAPASMTSAGVVTISLTAAQTLTLQAYAESACLVFQIDADKNDLTDAHRLQGKVDLFPEIAT